MAAEMKDALHRQGEGWVWAQSRRTHGAEQAAGWAERSWVSCSGSSGQWVAGDNIYPDREPRRSRLGVREGIQFGGSQEEVPVDRQSSGKTSGRAPTPAGSHVHHDNI